MIINIFYQFPNFLWTFTIRIKKKELRHDNFILIVNNLNQIKEQKINFLEKRNASVEIFSEKIFLTSL